MIDEKKTREEFLEKTLGEFTSISNAIKRIYARIPYVCNLSKGSGSIDDCKRILGLTVDRNELNDINRELSLLKLSIESSVSKISSQTGILKRSHNQDNAFDGDLIRTARVASSRVNDFSKYVSTQSALPESEVDIANKFLIKTNSEFGIKDIFNSIGEGIKSIQNELTNIRNGRKFVMSIACGISGTIEKDQAANFIKHVILSTEPNLEDSLSISKTHPNGAIDFHFNSIDSAQKARAAILVSFKQSNSVAINISELKEGNVKKKCIGADFSI